MQKIKAAIIGMGYIGKSHLETLRRIGCAEVVALADEAEELAREASAEYGIKKCYGSADEVMLDPEIEVVHDCTPNHKHFEVNVKAIEAGKHVFSEKPLGRTSAEARRMLDLLVSRPEVVGGVNFCYRMYPLAQEMKARVAAGEIGVPRLIHGSYLQDWLLFDTDYNWRVQSQYGGASRCVADIGSHWMDLAQNITGARITEVCADKLTAFPVRKKPAVTSGTFSRSLEGGFTPIEVDTEDYAGVLLRFDNGARGAFQCSQVSAGRKCFIDIEIDGECSSFHWNHETPDHMWKGNRDRQNEQVIRNPILMPATAQCYTALAAGHSEGWNDAFKNNLSDFYRFIAEGKRLGTDPCNFATFDDAYYIMRVTDAILESAALGCWVKVGQDLPNK